jgi:nitrogen fixation NifU-like protein
VYAKAFLDHFEHPRNQGSLERATHRGEAEDAACGDRLAFDLSVADGVVTDARFRVQGCPGAIAVGSAYTVLLVGRAARPDAVTNEEVERLLEEVPRVKRHALRLATAALRAALAGAVGAAPEEKGAEHP